jgi:hypothetical protein
MRIIHLPRYARNLAGILIHDKERKPLLTILAEYSKYLFTNRTIADQYFSKFFYRKGSGDYENYVLSEKNMFRCWESFNKPDYKQILENKYVFYRYMSGFSVRISRVIAYTDHQMLLRDQEMIYLSSPEKLEEVLLRMTLHESASRSIFIKKNNQSSGGENIHKLELSDYPLDTDKRIRLYTEMTRSTYIIQPTLVQHARLNALNPASVNTIRINTFMDLKGQVEVLASFLRFGIKGSYVDNIHSGGGFIGIHRDNGTLRKKAFADITHGMARSFQSHPDTGLVFEDFEIPFYREAEKLVLQAAQNLPELRLIGWDVAITETGPEIIEGNDHSGIHAAELANGGFRRNPVFIKMLQEIQPCK